MTRIENPNPLDLTRKAGAYSRRSLDGEYSAWYAPITITGVGGAFKSWSIAPNALPGSGTLYIEEVDAIRAVDNFMEVSVPRQREERAGHTLPTDRLEYVDGALTVIDTAPQYNHYFVSPEKPDSEPGSVSSVEAVPNGLGRFYLRRYKRREDGTLEEQWPEPQVEDLLEPLFTNDIHSNYWGADDDGQWYPVAADIANAAFTRTWPPYEPRRLYQDDEQMVLRRRRAGLAGDPVAGQPNEEERLEMQRIEHEEARARQRDLPIDYT